MAWNDFLLRKSLDEIRQFFYLKTDKGYKCLICGIICAGGKTNTSYVRCHLTFCLAPKKPELRAQVSLDDPKMRFTDVAAKEALTKLYALPGITLCTVEFPSFREYVRIISSNTVKLPSRRQLGRDIADFARKQRERQASSTVSRRVDLLLWGPPRFGGKSKSCRRRREHH